MSQLKFYYFLINVFLFSQFIAVVLFITLEKQPTSSPKRVRLLSERVEGTSEQSSDREDNVCENNSRTPCKSAYVDLVNQWNQKNAKINGYGTIAKSIDYIS